MGKKQQKKKKSTSLLSSFLVEASSSADNSLCDSSNISLQNTEYVPEKLLVSSPESADINKYALCLRSDFKDVIFLHPFIKSTLNIEDLVLVKGQEKTILCHSYPLKVLKKTVIVFPKDNTHFKSEDFVSLIPYDGKLQIAEEVFISCGLINYDQNMLNFILRLICDHYIYVGMIVQWSFFDKLYRCTISRITYTPEMCDLNLKDPVEDMPKFYRISYKTVLKYEPGVSETENSMSGFENIGGLKKQIHLIRKYIHIFFNSNTCRGSVFCSTLMLYGPSGTGKSLVLDAVCKDCKINVEKVMWYSIYSKPYSEAENELKNIFQNALKRAPSIIIMDEFNHLCPSRSNADNSQRYITKKLGQLIDMLDDSKVMIIAAANNTEYDESVLQTSKRMEIIKFQIPTSEERTEILQKLLNSIQHQMSFEEISECATLAHGFTGKDLFSCIKKAQLLDAKIIFSSALDSSDFLKLGKNELKNTAVKYSNLKRIIKLKKPTVVSADNIRVKKVTWADIGGMSHIIEKLKQLVEWPLKHPEAFKHFNVNPPSGILMYGPPGCSKTMIAKALATECELNFISKNASDLFDKYVGESEKAVRDLFALAKAKSPCIIFLDEIDALAAERGRSSGGSGVGDRIVNTFLTEMSGVEELYGVIIIAATNRPDVLDEAFVRNGRINHFIYVPLPDSQAREEIFKISMKNRTVSADFDFKYLSEKTEGYTGAEIVNLCNEAAFQLLSEDPFASSPVFTLKHFDDALKYVLPRTSKEMIHFYESFNKKFSLR